MKFDVYDIVLAALLHDIGKVMQRADMHESDALNETYSRSYQKGSYSGFSYKHSAFTAEFMENNKPAFYEKEKWGVLTNITCSHHKKNALNKKEYTFHMECLINGDHISAGMDRKDESKSNDYLFKKILLNPIVSKVRINKEATKKSEVIPLIKQSGFLKKMTNGEDFYEKYDKSDQSSNYKKLYDEFYKEYEKLLAQSNKITKKQFIDALDYLLEEYFWCVPSNTMEDSPSNSLYYHSRNTAAVAAAIFKNGSENRDSNDYVLIGGDVSGIQSYIMGLNEERSKHASKFLRARSYKVKILSEMVLFKILEELDLPRQSVLMNAGGKFMILAPKEGTKEKLDIIKKAADEEFFKKFQGRLNINLDYSYEVCLNQFHRDKFRDTVEDFFDSLEETKKKKYASYFCSESWDPEKLKLEESFSNSERCEACGSRRVFSGKDYCPECSEDKKIGQQLPTKKIGIISSVFKKAVYGENLICLFKDTYFYLTDKLKDDSDFKEFNEKSYFFKMDEEVKDVRIPFKPNAAYVPQYNKDSREDRYILPEKERKNSEAFFLDFGEISRFALVPSDSTFKNFKGSDFLAVVKGDVDNLGVLFSEGLKKSEEDYTLTSYGMFSSMIDFFFSVYIPELIKKKYPKMYIVYTGGDDFAIIGPWNKAIEMITEIKKVFGKYVNNEEIHFSCGIELMHGKSAIKNVFFAAEEKLNEAKKYEIEDDAKNKDDKQKAEENSKVDKPKKKKNAVTIFGITMSWKKLDEMMELSETYKDWYEQNNSGENNQMSGFSMQFMYKLFTIRELACRCFEAEEKNKKKKVDDLMYKSYLVYHTRNFKNKEKCFEEHIEELQENKDNYFYYIGTALHKVIYENRKFSDTNE